MRFAVRVTIPTEVGNRLVKDPNFIPNIEQFMKTNNVEAAYFYEAGGERSTTYILDLPSTDKIPAIAEPLFQMGAKVQFHPVMLLDDLKKAIQSLPK